MEIAINSLSAGYKDKTVLHDIDLTLQSGKVTVIVGPNGCGKTTLLKCIARLIKPTAGEILLGGLDIWNSRPSEVAKILALLPQQPSAPEGITVEELIRYGRHPHQGLLKQWSAEDYAYLEKALQETQLLDIRAERLEHLSGGQRQRAWLAMCLAQDTPHVLLDEPTSALDLGHQVEVLNLVKKLSKQGKSFVIVLHDLFSAARYADHLVAMKEGKVVAQGHPHDIVSSELIKVLYNIETDVLVAPGDNAPLIVPKL